MLAAAAWFRRRGIFLVRRGRLCPTARLRLAPLEVFPQRRAQAFIPRRAAFGLGALGHAARLREGEAKMNKVLMVLMVLNVDR